MHAIDITPSMRAGIMEKGFPVFHGATIIPVPRERLTPAAVRRLDSIESFITKLVRSQAGDRINVELPARLESGEMASAGYGGVHVKRTYASYTPSLDLVKIALDDVPAKTMYEAIQHETWHAIEDNVATDDEIALLQREEARLRATVMQHPMFGQHAKGFAGFEIRAMAYQIYSRERARGASGTDTGFHIGIRKFFEKVMRTLRQIRNFVQGMGFRTAEDVFDTAYSGGMRDRPNRKDAGLGSRIEDAVRAEMKTRAEMARTTGLPTDMPAPISSYVRPDILKTHPDYAAAKAGEVAAAYRFVRDLVKPETIEEARKFGPDAIYLPVVSEEATGPNRIPRALAELYAHATGAKTARDIQQVTKAYHTGANAMERLLVRPEFEGPVQKGGRYVLVDDVTVMGSTLAELAGHIRDNGGEVAGVVALVNAARDSVLTPKPSQIREIARRFGNVIRKLFDIEPAALSGPEATYILNFRDADALAARATAARGQRSERLASKGIQPAAGGAPPVEPPVSVSMAAPSPPPPRRSITERIQDGISAAFTGDLGTRAIENFSNLSHRVRILQNLVEARFEGEVLTRPDIHEPISSRLPDAHQFYAVKRLFPGKVANEVAKFNKQRTSSRWCTSCARNGISLAGRRRRLPVCAPRR